MKVKVPITTRQALDVSAVAVTAPAQDVLAGLGTRIVLSLKDGTATIGETRLDDFDAVVGLGAGQARGRFVLMVGAREVLERADCPLPSFLPHPPDRPGVFRLTVQAGRIMEGGEPWTVTPEALQAWIDG